MVGILRGDKERVTQVTKDTLLNTLASADPAALRLLDDVDDLTERVLAAAFEQIAVVGWRRSTVDDVAKRAGLSRATVYRRFPNKKALTEAVVYAELRKYMSGVSARVEGRTMTLADRMAESSSYTVEFIIDHPLLRRLLETEPDSILPALTVEAGPLIGTFREFCASLWKNEIYGDAEVSEQMLAHLRTVAELHIRIALSLILTRQTVIGLETPEQARRFALDYLAPMLDTGGDSSM
ncbi:TetR family transcriptional regulator [Mycobacteroides stephanolepidis]|uniref:TetR family transcriptional regulator n=1 Tax=[Mycobacterium] stephanolepidis TaxID=1520670 RepID=A0A1Z4F3Y1_9MYCO|nr:TetR family transcriptional regulator [[Mycobacterium] stephanolepidis]